MHDLESLLKTKKESTFPIYGSSFTKRIFGSLVNMQKDFHILHLLLVLYQSNECNFFQTLFPTLRHASHRVIIAIIAKE